MADSKLVLRCDKQNKILPKYPFFGDCSRPSFASICCHVYFVADADYGKMGCQVFKGGIQN